MEPILQYQQWCEMIPKTSPLYRELIEIAKKPEEIHQRFAQPLTFGTGGLRGIMGVGSSRMNQVTVAKAAYGFAQLMKSRSAHPTVAIAYDSRHNSRLFAEISAVILGMEGVGVYLFDRLMPTPVLSFTTRQLRCTGGIMITASHNPAEYNGFKAYDHKGCQLGEEDCERVMAYCEDYLSFQPDSQASLQQLVQGGSVVMIGDSLLEDYLKLIRNLALQPDLLKETNLKVVYTPLYGAGREGVERVFQEIALKNFHMVESQSTPNGEFTSCPYPNPESLEAMQEGFRLMKEVGGDLLLATDPDADRIGVGILDEGRCLLLSGNQVGILILDYLLVYHHTKGTLPTEGVVVSTIVSSPMAQAMTEAYGLTYRQVLTGFKNIGAVIGELEQQGRVEDFFFGFEESCGYLNGSYVRDKDGVAMALLMTEITAFYRKKGMTLLQRLDQLYGQYGYHYEEVQSMVFKGTDGMEKMAKIMDRLFIQPPSEISGQTVVSFLDYQHNRIITKNGEHQGNLPYSSVAVMVLSEGDRIVIRPSGTEPKLKIYYLLKGPDSSITKQKLNEFKQAIHQLSQA